MMRRRVRRGTGGVARPCAGFRVAAGTPPEVLPPLNALVSAAILAEPERTAWRCAEGMAPQPSKLAAARHQGPGIVAIGHAQTRRWEGRHAALRYGEAIAAQWHPPVGGQRL
ncbi:hypothetical protein [Paracraurococcus lichenis]|uniref:Uncharacterized protein n=1 Tax=Paracraurococcus lichenis TaxID=3064888 RepID=A0ABT9E6V1_9PROT|nr:hypothetical protein [Paracraurococcus sp. LOR1-02]MDO9711854.1 hypothetical protein [Paracraurococcus sp. LOR1-02]